MNLYKPAKLPCPICDAINADEIHSQAQIEAMIQGHLNRMQRPTLGKVFRDFRLKKALANRDNNK